jgi:bacterioferritin (cytochrome b1)
MILREITVGKNVQEMLLRDLDLELDAVKDYNAAIHVAAEEKDNGSRDLFVLLLEDEEGHVEGRLGDSLLCLRFDLCPTLLSSFGNLRSPCG